jgi:protein-tyrosine phosphatase
VIDLHFHVLPGIDDGPQDIEESVVLSRAAAAAGTRILVATPHVSQIYRNDSATIGRLVGELNARLGLEDLALEVRAGAEIAMAYAAATEREELQRFALGGGAWILVEPPLSQAARNVGAPLFELQQRGHHIVLAHPERCPAFQRDPATLRSLVADGALTSITAGSLVGRFGASVRRFALTLLRDGLVHNVASDAHDLYARAPGTAAELERVGVVGALADWLTHAMPAAILDGGEIPSRPAVPLPDVEPARRWRWGRGRLLGAS